MPELRIVIEIKEEYDSRDTYGDIRRDLNARIEEQLCRQAVTQTHGNKSEAARLLRMDRKHLSDMCKRHGVFVESELDDDGS